LVRRATAAGSSSDRSFCHTYGRGNDEHWMISGWPYSIVAVLTAPLTSAEKIRGGFNPAR
jgi:hypothetical protein